MVKKPKRRKKGKKRKKCLGRELNPEYLHAVVSAPRRQFDKIMNLRYARKLLSINPI